MEIDILRHIIDNPQSIKKDDIESLSSIVETYPYFTVAQVLLAIGYDLNEDKKASKQLRLAAAMVPDRNVLRHHIAESKDKTTAIDLPDELGNENQQSTVNSQQSLEDIVIPKIDLSKSQEELSREMMLLEEKRKSLDELKSLIELRLVELRRENEESKNKENTLSKTEIIDKFIAENPQISRPKQEFYDPMVVAQTSVLDKENIISETLATIYLNQGYVDKAISMYEKLSLKNPEKSVYFAELINKAKNKFNN